MKNDSVEGRLERLKGMRRVYLAFGIVWSGLTLVSFLGGSSWKIGISRAFLATASFFAAHIFKIKMQKLVQQKAD